MKQLFLISGLSLLSVTAFSQQVSSERKMTITPVPTEEKAPKENTPDSLVMNMTMGKTAKPYTWVEPVSRENQTAPNEPGQVPTVHSSAKKPE